MSLSTLDSGRATLPYCNDLLSGAHDKADPVIISPAAAADRLHRAPGPPRGASQNGSTQQDSCPMPSLFGNLDNGHVDWSFPRQGSYGSLSSAAHNARVRLIAHHDSAAKRPAASILLVCDIPSCPSPAPEQIVLLYPSWS